MVVKNQSSHSNSFVVSLIVNALMTIAEDSIINENSSKRLLDVTLFTPCLETVGCGLVYPVFELEFSHDSTFFLSLNNLHLSAVQIYKIFFYLKMGFIAGVKG